MFLSDYEFVVVEEGFTALPLLCSYLKIVKKFLCLPANHQHICRLSPDDFVSMVAGYTQKSLNCECGKDMFKKLVQLEEYQLA